jgi:hypothetical protein
MIRDLNSRFSVFDMNEEERDAHEEADASDDDVGDAEKRVFAAEDGRVRQDDALRPGKLLHLVTFTKKLDKFYR